MFVTWPLAILGWVSLERLMTTEGKINGAKHRELLYPDHLTQTPE